MIVSGAALKKFNLHCHFIIVPVTSNNRFFFFLRIRGNNKGKLHLCWSTAQFSCSALLFFLFYNFFTCYDLIKKWRKINISLEFNIIWKENLKILVTWSHYGAWGPSTFQKLQLFINWHSSNSVIMIWTATFHISSRKKQIHCLPFFVM